jgi:hypothetical protein
MQLDTKESLRVRDIAGPALAMQHEQWRGEALQSFENAKTDEDRLRCQVAAVMHRDLAALWRDDGRDLRNTILEADGVFDKKGAQEA